MTFARRILLPGALIALPVLFAVGSVVLTQMPGAPALQDEPIVVRVEPTPRPTPAPRPTAPVTTPVPPAEPAPPVAPPPAEPVPPADPAPPAGDDDGDDDGDDGGDDD